MDYERMGRQIRIYRQQRGLTQEQLAAMVKVSTSFIGHVERGSRKASLETLEGICRALNISMDTVAMPPRGDVVLAQYTDSQIKAAQTLLRAALDMCE